FIAFKLFAALFKASLNFSQIVIKIIYITLLVSRSCIESKTPLFLQKDSLQKDKFIHVKALKF
ncbi:hypothetical protein BpHYR1_039097, partial [Brachionus plicatilis]